ncbi:MAG: hypothetical protein ACYTDX_01410 [Planctomycetota bacterium]|jgi:hypothetical protein
MVRRDRPVRRHGESGLSLVQTLIGLTIISSVLAMALVVRSRDFHFIADTFDEVVAREVAAARLEEMDVRSPGRYEFTPQSEDGYEFPTVRGVEVVRDVEHGLREVIVSISWEGAGGARRSVEYTTLRAVEVKR